MSKQNKSSVGEKSLWGIDMGGTKMEGVVLKSAEEPEVIFRDRLPTEADQDYGHILKQTKKSVDIRRKETGYKPTRLGIGRPGVQGPKLGTMKNRNAVAMNGKPMKKDLENLLGIKLEL